MSKNFDTPLSDAKNITNKIKKINLNPAGNLLMQGLLEKRKSLIQNAINQLKADPYQLIEEAKQAGIDLEIETLYKNPDQYDEVVCQQQAQELASQLMLSVDVIQDEMKSGSPVSNEVECRLRHLMSGRKASVKDTENGITLFYEIIKSLRKIIPDSDLPRHIDHIQHQLDRLNVPYKPYDQSVDMRNEFNRLKDTFFKAKLEKFENLDQLCSLLDIQRQDIDQIINKASASARAIKTKNYGIPIQVALFIKQCLSSQAMKSDQSEFSILLNILEEFGKEDLSKTEKFMGVYRKILKDLLKIARLLNVRPNNVFFDSAKLDSLAMEILIIKKERSVGTGIDILQGASRKCDRGQKISEKKEELRKKKITKNKEVKEVTRSIGNHFQGKAKEQKSTVIQSSQTMTPVSSVAKAQSVERDLSKGTKSTKKRPVFKYSSEKAKKLVKAHNDFTHRMRQSYSLQGKKALLYGESKVEQPLSVRKKAKHNEFVSLLGTTTSAKNIRSYLFSKSWRIVSGLERSSPGGSAAFSDSCAFFEEKHKIRSNLFESTKSDQFIEQIIKIVENYKASSWSTSVSMVFDFWNERATKKNTRGELINTLMYHLNLIKSDEAIDEIMKFKVILHKISILIGEFDKNATAGKGSQNPIRVGLGRTASRYLTECLSRSNLQTSSNNFDQVRRLWDDPTIISEKNFDQVCTLRARVIELICANSGSTALAESIKVATDITSLLDECESSVSLSL